VTAHAALVFFMFLGGPGRIAIPPGAETPDAGAPADPALPADAAAPPPPATHRLPSAVPPPPAGVQPPPAPSPPAAVEPANGEPVAPVAVVQPAPLGPAREPAVRLRPISHIVTREPAVAITFDACATSKQGNGFDRAVFDILKTERVPATIFVSGRWVESHPDAMSELAREPLIEFGDHSYDHPHMSRLSADRIAAEIDRTEAALGQYGKRAVAFRPPFGDWNPRLIEAVQGRQLPTVTWDVVSGDPSVKTTSAAMIREVLRRARAGSIIIFHINGRGWKTAEALPTILAGLRERGFRFVTLSELMGAGGAP
jgi:peptidoglycan/xylan/chitin deacetylase (PgdA/CDA1 family)